MTQCIKYYTNTKSKCMIVIHENNYVEILN